MPRRSNLDATFERQRTSSQLPLPGMPRTGVRRCEIRYARRHALSCHARGRPWTVLAGASGRSTAGRVFAGVQAADIARLASRVGAWRNTFDHTIRMARGRNADGSWGAHSEFAWGGAHIEGGVWQCTWGVPHQPKSLAAAIGGPAALEATLDRMLEMPPHFETGSYRAVIHEMSESAPPIIIVQ